MKKLLSFEKNFFPQLMKLALPMAAQSIFQTLVGFADTKMVSSLGENSLAAVTLSNQVFAVLLLVFFGMGSGSSIFFSRYWGSADYQKIRRVFGFALIFSVLASVVGGFYIFSRSETILNLIGESDLLTKLGRPYLLITSFSFPMVAISIVISSFWRSLEKSHYPMWVSFMALFVDIIFNYFLIFGKFGFPRLGIAGAAYATLLARFIECLILVILFLSPKNPVRKGFKDYFAFIISDEKRELITSFLKVVFPFMIADVVWVLAITAYKKAYASIGASVVAAFGAVDSVYQIFMVAFIAVGGASGVMIGKSIGEHRLDRAHRLATDFIKLNFMVGIPLGFIFMAMAPFMAGFFNFTGPAAHYAFQATILCGVFLSFRSLEFFLTVGILRSGGDSRYYFIAQLITLWVFGVPAVFIAIKFFNASPAMVFTIVLLEEVLRDLACYVRYRSERWIHVL